MAKFKPCNENQLVMLPISLQDQLVPGTLEHTLFGCFFIVALTNSGNNYILC